MKRIGLIVVMALALGSAYAQSGKVAPQKGDSKVPTKLAAPEMTKPADDKADKLSDVEQLKLQLAQKDLVIAQLQSQLLQMSSKLLTDQSTASQTKMASERDEISKAHGGAQVLFDPTGLPYLAPKAEAAKPEAKK